MTDMHVPDLVAPRVYAAINAVQRALARTGITKDRRNTQSNYNFRGIDDVYNAISPLMAEHGLCIVPRMLTRSCVERQSKAGGALFYVTVEAEFDFVAAADGSRHTARTFGEAMDSGDKATNKAMSAAYKYAAFQTFAIPTEANEDADAQTHEVMAEVDPQKVDLIDACATMEQLAAYWKSLSAADRRLLAQDKERRKTEIIAEARE